MIDTNMAVAGFIETIYFAIWCKNTPAYLTTIFAAFTEQNIIGKAQGSTNMAILGIGLQFFCKNTPAY